MLRIVLFRRWSILGSRWYFTIKAANGEPIAQSEGYNSHRSCRDTADLLKAGLANAIISDPVTP